MYKRKFCIFTTKFTVPLNTRVIITPTRPLFVLIPLLFLTIMSYANTSYFDDPTDCDLTVEVPDDFHICFDEEFSLDGIIIGDYDDFIWFENGVETNHDLDEDVSIDQTTTFTLIAYKESEENIIINGDFEAGDSDFTTDYVVGTSSCFGLGFLDCEGTYGVIDDPSDGHANFSSCSDAEGGGNMMVVNGAPSLQQIWCQEVCVEPGATYVFSAWAASVNPSSPAQLQFAIDGGLIGNLFSLSSSTCDWEEFEAEWTSSSETTIEICVTNQNTAAGGNDFAIDGIGFVRVCEDMAEFTVTHSEFEAEFNDPEEITCINNEVEIVIDVTPLAEYDYEWSTDEGNIVETLGDDEAILVDQSGVYFVTVTDMYGCSQEYDIEVEEDIEFPELDITSSNDIDCINSTSELEVDANLNGLDYEWYDSENEFLSDDNEIEVSEGGLYYVLAFDDDTGCETLDSIFVVEDTDTEPFDISLSNHLDCNNATATLSVDITDVDYIWTNNQTNTIIGNGNSIIVLEPGDYSCEVVFSNGCTSQAIVSVLETNPNFEYLVNQDSVLNCNITSAQINLDFDSSLYDLSWLPNDNLDTISEFQYSTSIEGTFYFSLIDELGCELLDSVIVSSDLTEPNVLLQPDSIACNHPVATIGINNPNDIYQITWTLEDGTVINADSVQLSEAATISYTVAGSNGCSVNGTYEVKTTEAIPSLTIEGNNIDCNMPSATLKSVSNEVNLTYLWLLPDSSTSTEAIINTDEAGIYNLTITNESGCQASSFFEVLLDTLGPQFNLPNDVILDCNNPVLAGVLDLGDNLSNIEASANWLDTNDLSFSISEPGDYILNLTANNGCSAQGSFNVSLDTLSPTISFLNVQEIDCNSPDFTLEYNVSNDIASLEWNGDNIPVDMLSQDINSAGTYTLIATANNGCQTSESVTITSSEMEPEFDVISTIINCNNPLSTVTINVLSDFNSIAAMSNGALISSENSFETDITDPITIEVVAPNGCSTIEVITVAVDTATADFTLSAGTLTCETQETQIALATSASFESALIYNDLNQLVGNINESITESGIYTVTVETSNGCLSSQEIEVTEIGDLPKIDNYESHSLVCEAGMTISNIEISGGQQPYLLFVNNTPQNQSGNSFTLSEIGTHIISVLDANGCSDEFTIEVLPITPVDANIPPEVTVFEGEQTSLNLTLNKPLEEIESIDWSPKKDLTCYDCLTPTFTGIEPTTYTILVIDKDGCQTETEIRVNIEIAVKYFIPNVISVGDVNNNAFTIFDNGEDIVNIQFLNIYDRWGNLVFVNKNFQPNDPSLGWDGYFNDDFVEDGVYVYYAVLELRNGEAVKESGDVTFLR